jgi:hypothetical protein
MESPSRKRKSYNKLSLKASKNLSDFNNRKVKLKTENIFYPSKYIFYHQVFQEENFIDNYTELSEYNIRRFFGDIDIFNSVMLKYISFSSNFINAKCDLGSVYIFDDIVIKIKPIEYYEKFIIIKNMNSKYIEEIYEIVKCPKSIIIVSKKYQSLNIINNINNEKLKKDIYKALNEFDKIPFSHKDVSLDNIVYDIINDNYILIDFDMVSTEYQKHIFRNSFKKIEI